MVGENIHSTSNVTMEKSLENFGLKDFLNVEKTVIIAETKQLLQNFEIQQTQQKPQKIEIEKISHQSSTS